MTLRTLILNPWMDPHRVVRWEKAICLLLCGKCGVPGCTTHPSGSKIDVLETYEATVSSPSVTLSIPAVARLKKPVATYKKGVKFSRTNVLTRDKFTCAYCGKKKVPKELTYDHVIPKSRWIGDKRKMSDWENIVTACCKCNRRKGNRTPTEAGMPLLFQPYRPKVLPMTQPFLIYSSEWPEIWTPYIESAMKQYRVAG